MQSMQRQFGKLWNKGPGDNAKVSILLKEYEDADNILAKIIDNVRPWRDSWASLLSNQLQVVTEYEGLYDPIVGSFDGHGRQAAPTPQLQLERTLELKNAYSELKTELVEEMAMIEERILKPATEARNCIAPIRKTIKNREDKRLDYERFQEKVIKLQRKSDRTVKDDAALSKAEVDMSRSADEFEIADNHLRQTLPPVISASFSLVSPLLCNLVMIQNRLLGLYYTTLHGYCEKYGFPSPPPPMQEVIAIWNTAFSPVRGGVESISFIARGKAVHQPMSTGSDPSSRKPSALSVSPSNGFRRTSSGLIPSASPQPRTLRLPSTTSAQHSSPALRDHSRQSDPASSSHNKPDSSTATDFTTATMLGAAALHRGGQRSHAPQAIDTSARKKPPAPPPPPKRALAAKPDEWVVAQYAFPGQGAGDLSFREGDRIRVVRRTETSQDWWVGELGGIRGSFPANYCRPLS
ncbi:hypothetical protein VTK56DRAFT_8357 [Thermocarpiscus australiensis]